MNDQVRIRPLHPDDAVALVTAVNDLYGNRYYQRVMYDAAELARSIEAGLRRGVIALGPEERVVGCVTLLLENPEDRVGFFTAYFVDPGWRRHGLGTQLLAEHLHRCRAEDGLIAGYADAEMLTEASQRISVRFGASEIAMLFEATWTSLEAHACGRLERPCRPTMWFLYRLADLPDRPVYVPREHAPLVQRLYNQARIPRKIVDTAAEGSVNPRCRLSVSRAVDRATGFIRVDEFGADFCPVLETSVAELQAGGCRAVHLDLPLADPHTVAFGAGLERLGFFFGGVLPEYAGSPRGAGDILRLQWLDDIPTQTDGLLTASPLGADLAASVLAARRRARNTNADHNRALVRCASGVYHETEARPLATAADAAAAWDRRLRGEDIDLDALRTWQRLHGRWFVGEQPTCRVLRPVFVTAEDLRADAATAERVGAAIHRAACRALADPVLRDHIFPDNTTESPAPPLYYRLDAAATPQGLVVFECNCGAISGTHDADFDAAMLATLPVTQGFPASPIPVFQRFAEALATAYRRTASEAQLPHTAIVLTDAFVDDVPSVAPAMANLARLLLAQGWPVRLQQAEALAHEAGRLRDAADGWPVDVVIRAYLTGDPSAAAVETAVQAGDVLLANPPAPHGNKGLLELIDDPAVAWTRIIRDATTTGPARERIDLIAYSAAHKDGLVLKPADRFGGRGVLLGSEVDTTAWEAALERAVRAYGDGQRYVVQAALSLPRISFPALAPGLPLVELTVNRNPLVCGGRFAGYRIVVAPGPLTNVRHGASSAAAFVLT